MTLRTRIVCPAAPGSREGNRVTALRWARILRGLGHRVRITGDEAAPEADLLVALHARRSARAVAAFRRRHPARPLVVALTGTDLYRDLPGSRAAARSLAAADRLVVLQPEARRALPPALRRKVRIVYQGVERIARPGRPPGDRFQVCVLGHLRAVKDPLRVAWAVRRLPEPSRLRVVHVGAALDPRLAERARAESLRNPRYRWVGERPRARALALLTGSHLLVQASRLEGGANAVGEAARHGVAILASRVPGNVGLLGARHPGLFPAGDTEALARALWRAESAPAFFARLRRASRRLAPRFDPARERDAWARLLAELRLPAALRSAG